MRTTFPTVGPSEPTSATASRVAGIRRRVHGSVIAVICLGTLAIPAGPAAAMLPLPDPPPRPVAALSLEFAVHALSEQLSTTLENEAIATVENEATQTDWMGDLSGGLGSDPAAGGGRCAAAAGGTGPGDRQVDGRAGVGLGPATEVRAAGGA